MTNSYKLASRINSDVNASVMLMACTTSNTLKPVLGDESYTPQGWMQYCNDNPDECKN